MKTNPSEIRVKLEDKPELEREYFMPVGVDLLQIGIYNPWKKKKFNKKFGR